MRKMKEERGDGRDKCKYLIGTGKMEEKVKEGCLYGKSEVMEASWWFMNFHELSNNASIKM